MIEITFDSKEKTLPEKWEEVPKSTLLKVLRHVFLSEATGRNYHELLRCVLEIDTKQWNRMMQKYFSIRVSDETKQKNAETLQVLLSQISWMWTDNMTKKPFEKITIEGTTFCLFEEQFKAMSFGELTDAYINANAYVEQLEEGEKRLNRLCATVCRPERKKVDGKWNGDHRIDYNTHISEAATELFEKVSLDEKLLILIYFLGSLKEFLSFYDIFETDGPPTPEDFAGQGYIKNQHLLAEKGIFGTMEHTKSANVHDVFLFLEENKKDVKEQIRQQKSNDSN